MESTSIRTIIPITTSMSQTRSIHIRIIAIFHFLISPYSVDSHDIANRGENFSVFDRITKDFCFLFYFHSIEIYSIHFFNFQSSFNFLIDIIITRIVFYIDFQLWLRRSFSLSIWSECEFSIFVICFNIYFYFHLWIPSRDKSLIFLAFGRAEQCWPSQAMEFGESLRS